MRTLEYLTDPDLRGLYLPGVSAAMAIALMSGPLSVLVVLKRMSFVGQGISHAAFGGVGLGLAMGLAASGGAALALDAVTLACSLAAAGLIAWLTRRGAAEVDTAIGIVLSVFMALGFVLHGIAATRAAEARTFAVPALEAILFGQLYPRPWADALLAACAAAVVVGTLALRRRPIVFWAFDETVSAVHGVRGQRAQAVTLSLLTLAVIATMKLAGIVLATSMLVLPGAAALRLGLRMPGTVAASTVIAFAATALGVVVSFEADLAPGPCVVGVMALVYAVSLAMPRRG